PGRRQSTPAWPSVAAYPWESSRLRRCAKGVTGSENPPVLYPLRPMPSSRSTLKVAPRADFGSRSARRMRAEGLVPGVVYSGGSEAEPFQVSEREVRSITSEGAALFDLEIDCGKAIPVVIKEEQLHPVRG